MLKQAWRIRKTLKGGKESRSLGILEPKSKMPREAFLHSWSWDGQMSFLISPTALPSTRAVFPDPDCDFCSVPCQALSSVLSSFCSWTPDLFNLFARTRMLCTPLALSITPSLAGKEEGRGQRRIQGIRLPRLQAACSAPKAKRVVLSVKFQG